MYNQKIQPVIGSGFLAKKFKKYKKLLKRLNITIYAAGISNSSTSNQKNLKKEVFKIKNYLKQNDNKIIYISTYSIDDNSRNSRPYVKNKIKIENFLRGSSKNYIIIRLPEIVGKNKNQNTLTNFFYDKIKNNKKFILFEGVKRNILDVDDAIKNCISIIKKKENKNKTINLLNRNFYTPSQIKDNFEKILFKKANYKIKLIYNNKIRLKNNLYIKFNKNYLNKIIKKYYLK